MPILIKGAGGGKSLPRLSNPAVAGEIMQNKQAIDQNGDVLTGTKAPLPTLSNPATAANIDRGKQAINAAGNLITGTKAPLPSLTNPASAADILSGKQVITPLETVMVGTMPNGGNFSVTSWNNREASSAGLGTSGGYYAVPRNGGVFMRQDRLYNNGGGLTVNGNTISGTLTYTPVSGVNSIISLVCQITGSAGGFFWGSAVGPFTGGGAGFVVNCLASYSVGGATGGYGFYGFNTLTLSGRNFSFPFEGNTAGNPSPGPISGQSVQLLICYWC